MRRNVSLTVILFVMLLAVAPMATADVPHQMNYQGQLTDDLGAPLDTIVSMTFTIYNDSGGGMVLWTETQTGVEVSGGLFSVLLGSDPPIPDTVFADDWRWLGIQIASDPEIAPLTKLVTVPYAFRVATVDGSTGGTISGDVAIQSDLDVDGDLRVTGKATIGEYNTNTGSGAFVAGGNNTTSGDSSAIGGGQINEASDFCATIGGGMQNTASGALATVGGGRLNEASGDYSTVSGGNGNEASFVGTGPPPDQLGGWSTVGGGRNNRALGDYSIIGGGQDNAAAAGWTAMYGGHSTVAGGQSNRAFAMWSTVSGGHLDSALAPYATVGGGYMNTAGAGLLANPDSGEAATVSGGYSNRATGYYSAIGGGYGNAADKHSSTVAGGYRNFASSDAATVSGGQSNLASGPGSSVGGGYADTASGERSTVSGGVGNTASGEASTVSGGQFNTAVGINSTISGGANNTISDDEGTGSTISGGIENFISNDYSAIGGGWGNSIEAAFSAIPGGMFDSLASTADYSMAFGTNVYISSPYRVVFFEGNFHGRLGINRDDHDGGINYPIHVGTNTGNGNGAHLTAGGSWQNGSSRSFKEDFQSLSRDELLAKIAGLPVQAWQYKGTDERHIGPVSEDFVDAFDVGVMKEHGLRDNRYLCPGDVAGVALAGVKELIQENQELKQIIDDFRQRIVELEKTGTSR